MRIRSDNPSSGSGTAGVVFYLIGYMALAKSHFLLQPSNECYESNIHSKTLNSTLSSYKDFFCRLNYEQCLCSVSLNKTETSENCLSNLNLAYSRILPLISFFLQIYTIKKLFTLRGKGRRELIHIGWAVSIVALLVLTFGIHLNSCYHQCIIQILLLTWLPLGLIAMHDCLNGARADRILHKVRNYTYIHGAKIY